MKDCGDRKLWSQLCQDKLSLFVLKSVSVPVALTSNATLSFLCFCLSPLLKLSPSSFTSFCSQMPKVTDCIALCFGYSSRLPQHHFDKRSMSHSVPTINFMLRSCSPVDDGRAGHHTDSLNWSKWCLMLLFTRCHLVRSVFVFYTWSAGCRRLQNKDPASWCSYGSFCYLARQQMFDGVVNILYLFVTERHRLKLCLLFGWLFLQFAVD